MSLVVARVASNNYAPVPKEPDRLARQVESVEQLLDGRSLLPPHTTLEKLSGRSLPDLRREHLARADVYKAGLDHVEGRKELTLDDLDTAKTTLQVLNNLDEYIETHKQGETQTLRDPQIGVVEDVRQFYEDGQTWGFIKLPTGSGKTVIFAEITEALDVDTLILVPKINLGQQTKEKFATFAPDVDVTCRFGDEMRTDGKVVITTYQYLAQAVLEGRLDISRFKLIIMDEAHKGIGPQMLEVLGRVSDKTRVLALTATPKYNNDKSLENIIGDCISELAITDAVRMGMLTPISVIVAKTTIDLSEVKKTTNGTYNQEELGKKLIQAGVSQACCEMYKKAFDGKSGIGFCASIAQAKAAAAEFKKAGISAEAISSEDTVEQRDKLIEAYRRGEIKMLFSADLLIEGFDSEIATVCFNLTPTGSLIESEQRAGRVFRLDPNNPNKIGYVVELVYDDPKRTAPSILFTEIIDGTACPPPAEEEARVKEDREKVERALAGLEFEGIKVITDSETIMELAATLRPPEANLQAPSGWVPLLEAVSMTKMSASAFQRLVLGFESKRGSDELPLSGRFRAASGGRLSYFYSPDVLAMVKDYRDREMPPAGWITANGAVSHLRVDYERAGTVLRRTAGDDPEMSRQFRGKTGRSVTYFSPECVAKAKDILSTDPLQWKKFNPTDFASKNRVPDYFVADIIKKMLSDPAPLVIADTSGKGTILRAHPSLEAIVAHECEKWHGRDVRRQIPIEKLAEELDISAALLRKQLARRQDSVLGEYVGIEKRIRPISSMRDESQGVPPRDEIMIRRDISVGRPVGEGWVSERTLRTAYAALTKQLTGKATEAGFEQLLEKMRGRLVEEWVLPHRITLQAVGGGRPTSIQTDHYHPKFVEAMFEEKRRTYVGKAAKPSVSPPSGGTETPG